MQITFTDKCKDNIIHAENGIKFNLKGYVFYKDEIKQSDVPGLLLNDIKKDKIICKKDIESIYEIRNNVFDLTFIPALDSAIVKNKEDETKPDVVAAKLGHYEIDLNKGITDKEFSTILLIGEEFNETNTYVVDKKKAYLAAVISDIDYELDTPKKIIFKISFTNYSEDEINKSLRIIDNNFNEFTKNEIIKDFNTIQLPDNYTLTPDRRNTDYNAEINIIKFDSEEGDNNVKFLPSNLVILDKTEKINNTWNMRPRVAVGVDNYDKKAITPHLELSYGSKEVEDNVFITNSIDFQHDNKHISINQSIGNRNLQVDILPEDIDEENKRCLKKRVKRSNLFDYSLISANKAFFKYDSHNSKYTEGANYTFEFRNRNNTLGTNDYPVEHITLIRSNDNNLSGYNNDSIFLDSNDNSLGYRFTDSIFINSNGTDFINSGVTYQQGSVVPQYNNNYENNVFIGTNDVRSKIKNPSVYLDNITFIGDNILSTYSVESASNVILTDYSYTIPSIIESTNSVTSREDLNIHFLTTSYNSRLRVGHEALIGFSGLSVDRLPHEQVYFKASNQIGYDKENNVKYFDYSQPSYEPNNTYVIKFGSYNANYNPNALNGYVRSSITEYKNNGTEYNDTFSSYFDKTKTFNGTTAKLHDYYFKHSQDSVYTNSNDYYKISADEGDFSINKLVVVGNGYDKSGENVTGYSPAQMASNYYTAGQYCKKIDLFSIEKDSYQLVHSERDYDDRPRVQHFEGIFAVRSTAPVKNRYFYYRSGNEKTIVKSFNKYNLQNAIYSTKGIFIPRVRTSNDVYPLTWSTLNKYALEGGDTKTIRSSFKGLKGLKGQNSSVGGISYNNNRPTKFVYPCRGITKNGKTTYDVYVSDIITYLNDRFKKVNVNIPYTKNGVGNETTIYAFYLINTSNMNIRFTGELRYSNNFNVPNKKPVRVLKPGDCLEIVYSDSYNTTNNGKIAGVLNFDYNK